MERYALVIGLKPEAEERYRSFHASVWPGVLKRIRASNIRNYSIFLKDHQLYSYFEYHGSDFVADMAAMAADEETKDWWAITDPMQNPLPSRAKGEWWARCEEVFHTD